MKDSWAEYDDGGIRLRVYFLERVSCLAPEVLDRLRPGLECKDDHSRWLFLKAWSKSCGVDTDWFRQSGEFTLLGWESGAEINELVPLGGNLVPVTITFYPHLDTSESILQKAERATEAAGLTKASNYHTDATIRRIEWLIRHDVVKEPSQTIIRDAGIYETKFYKALRDLRQRLGMPPLS